ncbi:MAG: DUF11 domain-containing protein [Chloroflexi bacterium]|nr:DUF11 domain-containing protein [Chloroflexota bacterium]
MVSQHIKSSYQKTCYIVLSGILGLLGCLAVIGFLSPIMPAFAAPTPFLADLPQPQGSPPLPDLGLNMIGPSILIPESVITYTINYANFGQDIAPSVVLTDILPVGITFGGAIPNPVTRVDQTLVFALGDLNKGIAGTIILTGTVGSSLATGTTLTNTAVISTPVQESDIDNNTGWVIGTVQRADLAINISGPGSTNPGQELDLTLNVANLGGAPATNTQLTVTLPAGFTFGGSHSATAQALGSQVVFRLIGTLAAGIASSIDISGTINRTLADNTILTFTAIASVSTQEDSLDNNQATYAISIQRADVQISIDAPVALLPGTTVTYTLSYTNSGTGVARDVVVTDYLSSLVTYEGSRSTPWREPPESGENHSRTWEIGILGPKASGIIVITGTLAPSLAPVTPITNSAIISTSTPEINSNNNTASQIGVIVYADVAGSFSLPGGPGQSTAIPGQSFSVGISYGNQGGAPAAQTYLTVTLPPLVSYQTDNSPWGHPSLSGVGGNTLTWQIGTLPPRSQGIFTATFALAPTAAIASQLTFTGSINTTTQDFIPSNNSWTSAPVLVTAAELVLSKVGPAQATPGEHIIFTLTVHNIGNLAAANVTVTDVLPISLTLTGAIPSRTGGTVQQPVWQLGSISAGGSIQVQVNAILSLNQPSRTTVTNTASVGTVTTESSLANNSASTNFTVAPGAPALVQLTV